MASLEFQQVFQFLPTWQAAEEQHRVQETQATQEQLQGRNNKPRTTAQIHGVFSNHKRKTYF